MYVIQRRFRPASQIAPTLALPNGMLPVTRPCLTVPFPMMMMMIMMMKNENMCPWHRTQCRDAPKDFFMPKM